MGKSKIQWTEFSWNPLRAHVREGITKLLTGWHCEKVSPGCANCYAERQNINARNEHAGTKRPYRRSELATDLDHGVQPFLDPHKLALPCHWKDPRSVFVCSMTDLFGRWVSTEEIAKIFAVMALTPRHTYQVLTKRSDRMEMLLRSEAFPALVRDMILLWQGIHRADALVTAAESYNGEPLPWPLPNVWCGASAEDQKRYDERVVRLLNTPAALRFVSLEPLLEPINLHARGSDQRRLCIRCGNGPEATHDHVEGYVTRGLDWVIVGGESGYQKRKLALCDVEWIRSIRDQCRGAGVPLFVKQMGSRWALHARERAAQAAVLPVHAFRADPKGGDMEEWPEDIRVREMPSTEPQR